MGWGPGPGKGGQKQPKHPDLRQSPHRTPNQKRKTFFFSISSRRLAESVNGLDHRFSKCSVWSPRAPREKPRGSARYSFFCFYF